MEHEQELQRLAEQDRLFVFDRFDHNAAWELGTRLRSAALTRGVSITIEVRLLRETVFFCAMAGTTPENADWARRKRNTVELLHRSSYAVGVAAGRDGTTALEKMGLDPRDHASHGGSVPIRVAGVGCVGAATVSGLPQRDDHELVAEVMAALRGAQLSPAPPPTPR